MRPFQHTTTEETEAEDGRRHATIPSQVSQWLCKRCLTIRSIVNLTNASQGQCKRRHIRCDLLAPICANCEKKALPCEYLELATQDGVPAQNSTNSIQDLVSSRNKKQTHHVLTFRLDPRSSGPVVRHTDRQQRHQSISSLHSAGARLQPPGSNRLMSHWYSNTAATITIIDGELATNFFTKQVAGKHFFQLRVIIVQILSYTSVFHSRCESRNLPHTDTVMIDSC